MKILFCRIANMQSYCGVENDIPVGGGRYVNDTGDAFEKYNFKSRKCADGIERHFGFFETKHRDGVGVGNENYGRNDLNINRIAGCEQLGNVDYVDDVLVVFCTTIKEIGTRVVGWYKHATVFRKCQTEIFDGEKQFYFVKTESKNVTLLSYPERVLSKWEVPTSNEKDGCGFGFGQSLHWFAEEKEGKDDINVKIKEFVASIVKKIDKFDGGI